MHNYRYSCRDCKEILTPVQGKLKQWHFRHRPDSNCKGLYDKAPHDYVVQLLLKSNNIVIDEKKRIYCVRMDLTDASLRTASKEEIDYAVLEDWTKKIIIVGEIPKVATANVSTTRHQKLLIIFFLALAAFIMRTLRRKKKPKTRYGY